MRQLFRPSKWLDGATPRNRSRGHRPAGTSSRLKLARYVTYVDVRRTLPRLTVGRRALRPSCPEFDFFVSSLNDDVAHATDVMIVGKRALVCLSVVLVVLFAECGPFCALQACCKGVQVETVMSEIDFFASSTGNINHFGPLEKLKNNALVGDTARWCADTAM